MTQSLSSITAEREHEVRVGVSTGGRPRTCSTLTRNDHIQLNPPLEDNIDSNIITVVKNKIINNIDHRENQRSLNSICYVLEKLSIQYLNFRF